MAERRERYAVKRLCNAMEVPRSSFYEWLGRPPSVRAIEDAQLLRPLRKAFAAHRGVYGSPRLKRALDAMGHRCGRHRVARLMREHGLVAKQARRFRPRPGRAAQYQVPNRLLERGPATRRGEVWVGDYTYIHTRRGWLFLAVVMDQCTRKVLGWATSEYRTAELTCAALRNALQRHRPRRGALFHLDQGIEYAANRFKRLLAADGLTQSISRRAYCYDNAHVESFFGSLKAESDVTEDQMQISVPGLISHIEDYLRFYNRKRLHSALGFRTPAEFDKLAA
ncbi:MAG: IS3 family transposase [Ectothiorhodospiraceae bacterium]|nr:IS3 family transposase [Ectothiorhodospiraceae bacterium]